MERTFAIVNPAAGNGRAANLAGAAISQLREKGMHIDVIASTAPGQTVQLANEAYEQGYRQFLAVGGDGTAHEILNGIFVGRDSVIRVAIGFLPLGTGNSFLRDFTNDGTQHSMEALSKGRTRSVDVLRLTHDSGQVYSLNLVSLGFTADVGSFVNKSLKGLGHTGYMAGVFVKLLQLNHRPFQLRCDADEQWDSRPCLFLSFNNSKYTGGTMLIAPQADPEDGLIEYIRCGAVSRTALLRTLPKIYNGKHMQHPMVERRSVRHVEFNIPEPVDVMIDGEIAKLRCQALDIVPSAVDIFV
jgi:YegS/Rv2252/BmrU family lipid kinase